MMSNYNKPEGAHFNQAKWSATICLAMLVGSFVAGVAGNGDFSVAQALSSMNQGMASAYSTGAGSAAAQTVTGGGKYSPYGFSQAVAQTDGHGGSAMAHSSTMASHPLVAPPAPVPPLVRPPPPPVVAAPAQNPIAAQLELRKKMAAQRAKQAEIESTLTELLAIEERATDSMDECSHWYDLSLKYHKLTGRLVAARESETKKKDECDALYKFVEETREKFRAFTDLAHANQIDYIIYVNAIVHDYLDLKYATGLSEQLAKEFDYLVQTDEHVQKQVEELENFLSYMKEALKPAPEGEPAAAEAVAAEEAAPEVAQTEEERTVAALAELRDLDSIIKDLIDKEETMTPEDLEELAKLGGMLDRALAEGLLPISSGKFHYLHGTLNGVRAIIVRKMVESGMQARAAAEEEEAAKKAAEEEEAAKKAAEEEEAAKKAAEEEEAAKKAAEEEEAAKKAAEEEAAKKKAEQEALLEKMKARFAKPPPALRSVAAAQTSESSASAITTGNSAAATAATRRSLAQAKTHGNSASAYSLARDGGSASASALAMH